MGEYDNIATTQLDPKSFNFRVGERLELKIQTPVVPPWLYDKLIKEGKTFEQWVNGK